MIISDWVLGILLSIIQAGIVYMATGNGFYAILIYILSRILSYVIGCEVELKRINNWFKPGKKK